MLGDPKKLVRCNFTWWVLQNVYKSLLYIILREKCHVLTMSRPHKDKSSKSAFITYHSV